MTQPPEGAPPPEERPEGEQTAQPTPPPPPPSYGAPDQPAGGYGQAPPPSAAYPPPQDGGFTPPPPAGPDSDGQYGAPGPGYGPGQSYGGLPAEPQGTDSVTRAWEIFKTNPSTFILAQLAWAVIYLIPTGIVLLILAAAGAFAPPSYNADTGEYSGGVGILGVLGIFGIMLLVLLYIVLGVVQLGAFASATLKSVDGGQVTVADFFKVRNFVQLLLLALLLGLASSLLSVTFIGPLAVMFFGVWAVLFVVDRNLGVIDAVKASVAFATKNIGQTFVVVVIVYLLNLLGSIPCGLGLLVTNPLGQLAYADYYRRATGPSGATASLG